MWFRYMIKIVYACWLVLGLQTKYKWISKWLIPLEHSLSQFLTRTAAKQHTLNKESSLVISMSWNQLIRLAVYCNIFVFRMTKLYLKLESSLFNATETVGCDMNKDIIQYVYVLWP